jgi:hypothetical protein
MNFVDCKPVVDQKVTSYTNSKECSRNKKTNSRKRKAVDPHSQRGEGGPNATFLDGGTRRSTRDRKPRKIRDAFSSDGVIPQAEEKMIAQAMENSKRLTKIEYRRVPEAPTFYPTLQEFENPITYIKKIQHEGMKSGICKIVPPKGWNPPSARTCSFTGGNRPHKLFYTKKQYLHRLEEGIYYPEGRKYTLAGYEEMAKKFKQEYLEKMKKDGKLKNVFSEREEVCVHSHSTSSVVHLNPKISQSHPGESGETLGVVEDLEKDINEELVREYWRIVETCADKVFVEYGNDLDTLQYGSGFAVSEQLKTVHSDPSGSPLQFDEHVPLDENDPTYYERCGWNLNNLPHWPGSLLRNIRGNYRGLNVPWLYMGMLFSTFAWHNEDNYLYSLSYNHYGATKVWYGVPGNDAAKFEQCIQKMKSQRVKIEKDVLHKLVLMTGPTTLGAANVPLVRVDQNPGEFVVTFPQAYHGGFSLGFNCGEAVNFALPKWIPFGRDASERYRKSKRAASISNERLLLSVASNPGDLKDAKACQLLINDLQRIVIEQKTLRQELFRSGILNVVPMPEDEDSESYDEKRQCHVCMHICYISALVCSCDAERVVCLRHFNHICNCRPQNKAFLFWHSIRDIEGIIANMKEHKRSLEKEGANHAKVEATVVPSSIRNRPLRQEAL